jgi:uncharacterized membrane protein
MGELFNFFDLALAFALFFMVDQLWLNLIARNWYNTHNTRIDPTPNPPRYGVALITYFLLATGMAIYVIPHVKKGRRLQTGLLLGTLFGIITYGIADFTNYANFSGYSLHFTIMDTLWGGLMCAIVVWLFYHIT